MGAARVEAGGAVKVRKWELKFEVKKCEMYVDARIFYK